MTFIREFIHGSTLVKSSLNAAISYGPTPVDYANFIREIFKEYVWKTLPNLKFKGRVESDESVFGRKIKDNKGKKRNPQVWIFGKFKL